MTMRNSRIPELTVLFLLSGFFALASPTPARGEASVQDARMVVKTTVDQVLEVLAHKEVPAATRRDQIVEIVERQFDFKTMSRLILARNYRRFTPDQRREFNKEFKLHLSRSYGSRIDRYDQQDVAIRGERVEPRGDVTVLTQVVGGQFDGVEMHYRLRGKDSVWRVIDVVIEGVSLVSSFRTQFKEVISQGGPEELIRRLREKNAGPEEEADVELAG